MFWRSVGLSHASPIEARSRRNVSAEAVGGALVATASVPSSELTNSSPCSSGSQLQELLDKNEVTLEELLDDDSIIQECKSLNARLIHLCAPTRASARVAREHRRRRHSPQRP